MILLVLLPNNVVQWFNKFRAKTINDEARILQWWVSETVPILNGIRPKISLVMKNKCCSVCAFPLCSLAVSSCQYMKIIILLMQKFSCWGIKWKSVLIIPWRLHQADSRNHVGRPIEVQDPPSQPRSIRQPIHFNCSPWHKSLTSSIHFCIMEPIEHAW